MRKSCLSVLVILMLSFAFFLSPAFGGEFSIYTENYAPFNFTEGGKVTGLSSEVMFELLNRVGHPNNIKVQLWSEAYEKVSNSKGCILYSMTRTKEREGLFKWVGPLATDQWVFYAKKGSGIKISNLDDARKVAKIGTCKDTATEQFLKTEGFTNIVSAADDNENAAKLMSGDIDLWIVGDLQGVYKAKTSNIDPSNFEVVQKIQDAELYIAFSKETPDSEILKWQKALDALKEEGIYKKIVAKYM
jgi:polar amino acid transport system substrate-binding protein